MCRYKRKSFSRTDIKLPILFERIFNKLPFKPYQNVNSVNELWHRFFRIAGYILITMKVLTRICIAICLTGICTGAKAQKLFFLFGHGQYASPAGSFKDNYGFGLGAEAGAGIGAGKTFFTGTVGYTYFDAKSGKEAGNLTYIPMKLGLRHYLLPGNLLFIHADAGVANIKERNTGEKSSHFTADVGGGVKLGPMEVGIVYDGFSDNGFNSWIGFKVGWRIGL